MITLVLAYFLCITGTVSATSTNNVKIVDDVNSVVVSKDMVVAANICDFSIYSSLRQYLDSKYLVVIYNLTGNVYDILFDQELSKTFGVLYYYDNNHTLRRYRISGEDVSKSEKKMDLDKYLNQYYERFKDEKSEIHDLNTITTDN
jgi:hypothetical protein